MKTIMQELIAIITCCFLVAACATNSTSIYDNINEANERGPIVIYRATGGIAGIDKRIYVYENGEVIEIYYRSYNKIKHKLSTSMLIKLKQIINSDFHSLPQDWPLCRADCLREEMWVKKGGDKENITDTAEFRLIQKLIHSAIYIE